MQSTTNRWPKLVAPLISSNLLLVSGRVHADLYVRQPDNRWLPTSGDSLEDSRRLESVGAQLRLADLYEEVDMAA